MLIGADASTRWEVYDEAGRRVLTGAGSELELSLLTGGAYTLRTMDGRVVNLIRK